jgi:hypothetical protein
VTRLLALAASAAAVVLSAFLAGFMAGAFAELLWYDEED